MTRAVVALAVLCVACGEDKPEGEAPPASDLRIGQLMVETGHRFETSGRAAVADRWGMARYQAHEIIELFEEDMPRALLPGECNDEVSDAAYFALMEERLPALVQAAEREDMDDYGAAFFQASQQCNTCHATCGVAFVEVPSTPGLEVPALERRGGDPPPTEEGSEADATDGEERPASDLRIPELFDHRAEPAPEQPPPNGENAGRGSTQRDLTNPFE